MLYVTFIKSVKPLDIFNEMSSCGPVPLFLTNVRTFSSCVNYVFQAKTGETVAKPETTVQDIVSTFVNVKPLVSFKKTSGEISSRV